MMRWRDGKIIEAWNEFDESGLLRQIGVGKGAPGSAAPMAKVKA